MNLSIILEYHNAATREESPYYIILNDLEKLDDSYKLNFSVFLKKK